MKYKVGDMTLLGEIADKVNIKSGEQSYYVVGRSDGYWFTESEIDAIIIKPKRNIDKMMELWDMGLHDDAVEILRACLRFTSYEDIVELRKPYIEPRKYPVLTPEELKAVKWLVEGGFKTIHRCMGEWMTVAKSENCSISVQSLPIAKFLNTSVWLTETPINLKELLDAQEDV